MRVLLHTKVEAENRLGEYLREVELGEGGDEKEGIGLRRMGAKV